MSYGNIMNVQTSGASAATGSQDRAGSGVGASHTMAHTDAGRMGKYTSIIKGAARSSGIDAALIAAIISRETRAGSPDAGLVNGWGDNGKAWGLMQVDVTEDGGNHEPEGSWDSEAHLRQGAGILVGFIGKIRGKFPNWTKEQQLKGGIAAYNMGPGSVRSYDQVDANTTGKDYSNDVVARAQWYRNNGF